jgi:hypothetical protein
MLIDNAYSMRKHLHNAIEAFTMFIRRSNGREGRNISRFRGADTGLGFNSLSGNIGSLIEVQANQHLRNLNIEPKNISSL